MAYFVYIHRNIDGDIERYGYRGIIHRYIDGLFPLVLRPFGNVSTPSPSLGFLLRSCVPSHSRPSVTWSGHSRYSFTTSTTSSGHPRRDPFDSGSVSVTVTFTHFSSVPTELRREVEGQREITECPGVGHSTGT